MALTEHNGSNESKCLFQLEENGHAKLIHAKNYDACKSEIHPVGVEQFCIADQINDVRNSNTAQESGNTTTQTAEAETEQKTDYCFFCWRLKLWLSQIPRKKLHVLLLCILANFISNSAFSLIAPLFPQVAQKKGMDLATIGLVFSVYQLVGFFASPFIGSNLNKIGAKFVYLSGLFVCGTAVICFGVLDKGPSGISFTFMCILCRCIESLGASAFSTASTAIVTAEFPDRIGTMLSFLNAGSTLGLVLGPLIGSILYDLGGFGMPFYVISSLSLVDAVFIYFFLPEPPVVGLKYKKQVWSLLRSCRILVPLSVSLGIGGISIFDATFTLLLKPFKLSTTALGAFYVLASGVYTIALPLWGSLADRVHLKELLLMLGLAGFGLGFLVGGPTSLLPFIPFELWSAGMGFVLLGISLGGLTVVGMSCMSKSAYELGYENNLETQGQLSGLYYGGYSFGGFVGPMAGSLIIEKYGFPYGFTVFGLVAFTALLMVLCFLLYRHRHEKTRAERKK